MGRQDIEPDLSPVDERTPGVGFAGVEGREAGGFGDGAELHERREGLTRDSTPRILGVSVRGSTMR